MAVDAATVNRMDPRDLDAYVSGVVNAQSRLVELLTTSGGLMDHHVLQPSRLPHWSVGHVLAHIALNAYSFVHLVKEAERGVVGTQYPAGDRDRTIEEHASDNALAHIERLKSSSRQLEEVWTSRSTPWDASAELVSGTKVLIADLPLRRWREVEVHMGDLGLIDLGCDGPECWSTAYVRHDVRVMTMQWKARGSMGMTSLPSSTLDLDDRSRLAWLLGRFDIPTGEVAGLL